MPTSRRRRQANPAVPLRSAMRTAIREALRLHNLWPERQLPMLASVVHKNCAMPACLDTLREMHRPVRRAKGPSRWCDERIFDPGLPVPQSGDGKPKESLDGG